MLTLPLLLLDRFAQQFPHEFRVIEHILPFAGERPAAGGAIVPHAGR